MNSRWKKPLYFLASVVVLVVLARVVLGLILPGEMIRQLAVDRVAEATGAEVSLVQASVSILPRLAITMGQGRIQGSGGALAARTGLENTVGAYSVDLDHLSIDLKVGSLLQGRIELGTVRLAISELEFLAEGGAARLEGFDLKISDLTLPASTVVKANSTAGGTSVPPGEVIPEELALAFVASAERLLWKGASYDDVKAHGELDALILLVESFTAQRSGGLVAGELEVDFERDPWGLLDLELAITDVPSAALLEPWTPDIASRLDCMLSGEVSGGCSLKDSDTVARTLELAGHLNSGQGLLLAGDWLDGIADYLGERQDLKEIRFDQLDHSFRVSQGRYLVEEFSLEGPDTDWSGNGWVGLDGTLDVDLKVKLPAGFTPDLGQWSWLAEGLRDQDKRVNLTLHLTGESARPTVALKLGGGKDSEAPNAADALKKGLGGFLDKLKSK